MNDFDALPPHDAAAEQAALGGMMLSQDAIADVIEILGAGPWEGPHPFYRPAHQHIYEAIVDLAGRGEPADAISLANYLRRAGKLALAGGAPYLHTVIAAPPTAANAGYYAQIIRRKQVARGIAETATRLEQTAWSDVADQDDLDGQVEQGYRVLDQASGLAAQVRALPVSELLPATLDRVEAGRARGISTGWSDLDRLTGGWGPGQLVTVGSRPAVGKTTILLNAATAAALDGVPTLLVSLEESRHEVLNRIMAAQSGVTLSRLRDGTKLEEDWDKLAKAGSRVGDMPLLITDDGHFKVRDIRAELRAKRRAKTPYGLVVVDYAQLMASGGRAESRQVDVSDLFRELKLTAREFDVPVLVGSQLNRGPEQRSNHRPLLADLRDSGAVEQDSDAVILLYRERVYDEAAGEDTIELHVAKNRLGETGTVELNFRGMFASARSLYQVDVAA